MTQIIIMIPIGILGQVWYLIVSIPDLCNLTYSEYVMGLGSWWKIWHGSVWLSTPVCQSITRLTAEGQSNLNLVKVNMYITYLSAHQWCVSEPAEWLKEESAKIQCILGRMKITTVLGKSFCSVKRLMRENCNDLERLSVATVTNTIHLCYTVCHQLTIQCGNNLVPKLCNTVTTSLRYDR